MSWGKGKVFLLLFAAIALPVTVILALQLSRMLEMRTYRLDYPTLIRRYATQYDLDPYVVAAIVHCESGNRSNAESHKGAIGLMQIMPETGTWIAEKLGMDEYETDMLRQPETNIHFGCWYLEFLYARFENDATVFVAYNAGHNRVRGWLDDASYSTDGETLSEVPHTEARNYVQKVQRAYDKYKTLYPDAFE